MSMLTLACLGAFEVTVDEQPITDFATDKVRALLVYLALEPGRPHSRQMLLGLLWPDLPQTAALNNLRLTLYRLRQTLDHAAPGLADTLLETTRHTIQLNSDNVNVDVQRLDALLTSVTQHSHPSLAACDDCLARLAEAVDLYRGEFLAGFGLADAPTFEEWALIQRERVAQTVLVALQRLAETYEQRGQPEQVLGYARRQLSLDPYREEAHRQVMRALAYAGQRAAALAQYETCRRVLVEELGVEPAPETRTLYERIRDGELTPTALGAPLAPHNLPTHLTPLIGRERELADLDSRLGQSEVRLLTLVGAGGIGKTRLALEIGQRRLDMYPDGVFFVSLASLAAATDIPTTIATTLGLTLQGGDPRQGLVRALRDKRLLLILDNFEHLLAGASLVVELLQGAPYMQIIVTSRAWLQVRGEHVSAVEALDYAQDSQTVGAATTPAVRLLAQAGRHVQPDFEVNPSNLAAALRICRLVQGVPLGLELAAAWVEMLSLDEIAAEIEQSADFLQYDWRDAPERQRSLRAVFEWSWRLLSEAERQAFRQVSVFRGGFTREAAQAVASVSLRILTNLLHKSLLQWRQGEGATGRYTIHELLRQFATEQLDLLPPERAAVEERHTDYYLRYVADRERRLARDDPKLAANEIENEIGNIRQAWVWAARHTRIEALDRAAYGLWQFYVLSGLASAGDELFGLAAESIRSPLEQARGIDGVPEAVVSQRVLSKLLAMHADFVIARSKHDQAIPIAQQAIVLGEASEGMEGQTIGYLSWGLALTRLGRHREARSYVEQALQLAQRYQSRDPSIESLREIEWWAQLGLGVIALSLGQYAEAQTHIQQSLRLCQRLGKLRAQVTSLLNLARIAEAVGDIPTARQYYEQAIPISRTVGYRWAEGVTQLELGELVRWQGEYALAFDLTQHALVISQEIADSVIEAHTVAHLGRLNTYLGAYSDARMWLDRFLRVIHDVESQAIALRGLLPLSLLSHHLADYEQALIYAEQAWQIAHRMGSRLLQANALVARGHALAGLQRPTEAALDYQQALTVYEELGKAHLATEPRAGLAALALALGDWGQALTHVEQILTVLPEHPRGGLDEPFTVYLICYRVLDAADDPRAVDILRAGYTTLMAYADHLHDPTLRRSFLENVATHRDLYHLAQVHIC